MTVRSALTYALPRLLLLAVVTWLLTLVGAHWMLAIIIASLISMLISIIFLGRPRQAVAENMERGEERIRARHRRRKAEREAVDGPSDEEVEDLAVDEELAAGDAAAGTGAAAATPAGTQDSGSPAAGSAVPGTAAQDSDRPTSSRSE